MKNNFKRNIPIYVFIALFILGLSVMCFPLFAESHNRKSFVEVIDGYKEITADYSDSQNNKIIEKAVDYNNNLTKTTVSDAFSNPKEAESDTYKQILDINGNGMMGYISIPKIDVKIPIYHGTSSKVLQKGVGHLEGSSFPVGGKSTNAILSAHRGLPTAKLFTDLNQLEEGDMFYIYVLDKTLAYKVEWTKVVEPSDTEYLTLQEGYDYVTLVTCTPYAINTHRLLVRGVRTSYQVEDKSVVSVNKGLSIQDIVFYIGLTFSLIILICFIVFLVKYYDKTNEKAKNTKDKDDKQSMLEDVFKDKEEKNNEVSSEKKMSSEKIELLDDSDSENATSKKEFKYFDNIMDDDEVDDVIDEEEDDSEDKITNNEDVVKQDNTSEKFKFIIDENDSENEEEDEI